MDQTVLSVIVQYVGLPGLVFLARVLDVSLGTLRIIFISRGKKFLAPLFGFIETFIWIIAVSQIIRNVQGVWSYVAYAAGFATGTIVGMLIEDRLAIGTLILRTILPGDVIALRDRLHSAGYGVTCVQGQGYQTGVTLVYTIIKRKNLQEVTAIIHQLHPAAFLSINELRSAEKGVFPAEGSRRHFSFYQ
ncbi:MAG: DUF2179 domain-containing protein, partial [Anaerolineales bacterium]|nr:DUF2179 domain-containing protein [Anaerolineales bacterium]